MSVLKPCLERNPNFLTQTFRELGLPRREVPMLFFFPGKIMNSATEVKNAITLKRLKVET